LDALAGVQILPTSTGLCDKSRAMNAIVGISGSLRLGSYNSALLRAAIELAPPALRIDVGSIRDIPLYDEDVETASGIPVAVAALKDRIALADGLLLVTPEYNQSLPGVFKNAIDWLSRPGKDIARVFGDKPVGIIGATPGGGGTRLAQTAWLPVLRTLGTRPWFGKQLYVAGADKVFDADGKLVDATIERRLADYLVGFTAFVATATRPPRAPE
jgi:chromate reductase, NAD(P)H dehydrogenase (quinone)